MIMSKSCGKGMKYLTVLWAICFMGLYPPMGALLFAITVFM